MDASVVRLADELLSTAAECELRVTRDLTNVVGGLSGSMTGLEHRLKTPESIAVKIRQKSRGRRTPK